MTCPECRGTEIDRRTYIHTVLLFCRVCGHYWSVGLKGDAVTR